LIINRTDSIISFCFDDFPRTAYTAGGSILNSCGAHGTYYASWGLINSTNELGEHFTRADIDALLSDGHELGSHTFSHISCRNTAADIFERDVIKGRQVIFDTTGQDAANFAYPYGHVSISSKRRIGSCMKSCRGIYGGINESVADLNLLRANNLYGDVDQFSKAETLILENVQKQGWLIFYTHDVRWNPSPFGCTPALFDRVISLAKKEGCYIASVREAFSAIQAGCV
jgi:peptidoglycan/xylan/chitin deacetylase (PgdA/CDA1 family)